MLKKIIISLLLITLIVNIASAAANDTKNPFSPGNAKAAYDKQNSEFKTHFTLAMGIFWLCVGSFMTFCLGGSAASYSAHKSGQFADPEKKSGGAISMVGIVLMAFAVVVCLSALLPMFGF